MNVAIHLPWLAVDVRGVALHKGGNAYVSYGSTSTIGGVGAARFTLPVPHIRPYALLGFGAFHMEAESGGPITAQTELLNDTVSAFAVGLGAVVPMKVRGGVKRLTHSRGAGLLAALGALLVAISLRAAPAAAQEEAIPSPPSTTQPASAPPAPSASATAPADPPSLIALPPNLNLVAHASPSQIPAGPTVRRHRLAWDERWHRFRVVEYVTTAVTGVAAIGVFYFAKPQETAHWVGPILFDEAVRNALRLRTRSGLATAAEASNIVVMVTPVQSLIDSVALPAIDRNFDLMWQLGMMDAQAYALSGLTTASLYDTVGRARPSYSDCQSGKSVDPLCNVGSFASFPSGHTSAAMTGAGLICAHHGALPLYGGGALDVAACVESIAVATGVGVLRMMADRHYVSDVMTGGAIGFFSGYALPRLLHYWKRPLGEVVHRDNLRMAVVLGGGAAPFGAQLVGMF